MSLSKLHLGDVSKRDTSLFKKIEETSCAYNAKYGTSPDFFVRCPGRVNLIGEHVDYNLYPVCPMALQQDVIIACGKNSEGISISNMNEEYPAIELPYSAIQEQPDLTKIAWYHYIFAGILCVAKKYNFEPKLNMLVKGTIPIAAGLSSSSALVCSAAIATLYSSDLKDSSYFDKTELAKLCSEGEKYIGTQGGAMDQSIMMYGQKGFASMIEFYPLLAVKNVQLPKAITFIVAHSGIKAEKAVTNDFNMRVAECMLAAKVIGHLYGLDWEDVVNLRELSMLSEKPPEEMIKFLDDLNMKNLYSGEDLCKILDIEKSKFEEMMERYKIQDPYNKDFKLLQRARHVFNECVNVYAFVLSCKENNLRALGESMTKSHNSLRYDYECSHPKLEEFVDYAMFHGALGARLTGAGWGGCIVAAVEKDKAAAIAQSLQNLAEDNKLSRDTVFIAEPFCGAIIVDNFDSNSDSQTVIDVDF